jgi:hypothetical protein
MPKGGKRVKGKEKYFKMGFQWVEATDQVGLMN